MVVYFVKKHSSVLSKHLTHRWATCQILLIIAYFILVTHKLRFSYFESENYLI